MKISNAYGAERNLPKPKGPVCSACGEAITEPNKTVPVASRNTLYPWGNSVIECKPCVASSRTEMSLWYR